jgi:hypothetical protein
MERDVEGFKRRKLVYDTAEEKLSMTRPGQRL